MRELIPELNVRWATRLMLSAGTLMIHAAPSAYGQDISIASPATIASPMEITPQGKAKLQTPSNNAATRAVDRKTLNANSRVAQPHAKNKLKSVKTGSKKPAQTVQQSLEGDGNRTPASRFSRLEMPTNGTQRQENAHGQEKPGQNNSEAETKPTREPTEPVSKLAESYCNAIIPTISERLMAWQRARLDKIRIEVEDKMSQLEKKKAELDERERRQQETNSRLSGNMVAILIKMRPDAAASQLAAMEESAAAALITRMDARAAGPILSEIPATKAARLAEYITGRNNVGNR